MNGDEVYRGLLDRGYGPVQAAAIAGNVLQESGGNPDALNAKEGANGLLQWRLDRLEGLQDFAKAKGTAANDPNTQLDYIGAELAGPERRSAGAFFDAPDLASANAALKRYIRYGDNSEQTRLANAQGFLTPQQPAQPMAAPLSLAPAAPVQQPALQVQQKPAAAQPAYAPSGGGAPIAADPAPAPFALLPPRPRIDLKTAYANLRRG